MSCCKTGHVGYNRPISFTSVSHNPDACVTKTKSSGSFGLLSEDICCSEIRRDELIVF